MPILAEENIKYCHVTLPDDKSFTYDHVHIRAEEQITLHQSAEWEISYIITGSGTRIVGNRVETFSAGEIVMIPPNMPHCWTFSEYDHDEAGKIENITIIFPDPLLGRLAGSFAETQAPIRRISGFREAVRFEGEALRELQMLMVAMRWQNNMEQLASLLRMFAIIAATSEKMVVGQRVKHNKGATRLQDVSRFMVNNYQRPISLDEVAKYAGMNRSSFCTFFKREKGKSFFTVLNEYRVDCSCLMLRETGRPIADVCYAVGFNDIPYYNRTFKRLKGLTPKDYRSRHQR